MPASCTFPRMTHLLFEFLTFFCSILEHLCLITMTVTETNIQRLLTSSRSQRPWRHRSRWFSQVVEMQESALWTQQTGGGSAHYGFLLAPLRLGTTQAGCMRHLNQPPNLTCKYEWLCCIVFSGDAKHTARIRNADAPQYSKHTLSWWCCLMLHISLGGFCTYWHSRLGD